MVVWSSTVSLFDHFEASNTKHLAQAVMDGKGAAILQDNMAKLAKALGPWQSRAL